MASLEQSVRPLTAAERRLLNGKISSLRRRERRYRARCVAASAGVWAVGTALTLLARGTVSGWWAVAGFWVAVATVVGLWILAEGRRSHARLIRSYEDALRRAEAQVTRIRAGRVVEFEEEEDEGACWAFQAGDRVVFVAGQEFYSSPRFPNSDFSLVAFMGADGRVVEEAVIAHGTKLRPERTISAARKATLRLPGHLETVDGRLEDVEVLLAR